MNMKQQPVKKSATQNIPVTAIRKTNAGNRGVGLSHYVPMPAKKKTER